MDKITIVSTGNGGSAGMHKITGDMTKIAAQVPALFEALSGMPMSDLLARSGRSATRPRTPKDTAPARRHDGSRRQQRQPA